VPAPFNWTGTFTPKAEVEPNDTINRAQDLANPTDEGKAGLLGASAGSDKQVYEPSGRYGAVMSVEGRLGTTLMPGVFAHGQFDTWSPGYLMFMAATHNGISRL